MAQAMWDLYWLTRALSINAVAGPLSIIWLLCFVFIGGVHYLFGVCRDSYDKDWEIAQKKVWLTRGLKLMLTGIVGFLIIGLAYVFTPDRDQAAVIVAGGAVVAAAQSDSGQRLASKSIAVLEGGLDNILGSEAIKKAKLELEKKAVNVVKGVTGEGQGSKEASGKN